MNARLLAPGRPGAPVSLRETLRILVVDDMSTSRGLIVQALEWMGIRNISQCGDGESAARMLACTPTHLVLSDYNMPGLDGIGLLEKLRTSPATARLGFILVTGRADAEMVRAGRLLGLNNIIRKPFTPDQMKCCIECVVGRL